MLGQKQHKASRIKGDMLAPNLSLKTSAHSQAKPSINYYPFGSSMVGYKNEEFGYMFKHQGQESDDEIYCEGAAYFYTYRMSDSRYGRFWSVDPIAFMFPHNSPYAYSENSVIAFVEWEGLEKVYFGNAKDPVDITNKTEAEVKKIFVSHGVRYHSSWYDKNAKDEVWTVRQHKNYWGRSSGTYTNKYVSEKSYSGGKGEPYFHDASRSFLEWMVAKEESFEGSDGWKNGAKFYFDFIATVVPAGRIVSGAYKGAKVVWVVFTSAIAVDNMTKIGENLTYTEQWAKALGGESGYNTVKVLKISTITVDYIKGVHTIAAQLADGRTIETVYDFVNQVILVVNVVEEVSSDSENTNSSKKETNTSNQSNFNE